MLEKHSYTAYIHRLVGGKRAPRKCAIISRDLVSQPHARGTVPGTYLGQLALFPPTGQQLIQSATKVSNSKWPNKNQGRVTECEVSASVPSSFPTQGIQMDTDTCIPAKFETVDQDLLLRISNTHGYVPLPEGVPGGEPDMHHHNCRRVPLPNHHPEKRSQNEERPRELR